MEVYGNEYNGLHFMVFKNPPKSFLIPDDKILFSYYKRRLYMVATENPYQSIMHLCRKDFALDTLYIYVKANLKKRPLRLNEVTKLMFFRKPKDQFNLLNYEFKNWYDFARDLLLGTMKILSIPYMYFWKLVYWIIQIDFSQFDDLNVYKQWDCLMQICPPPHFFQDWEYLIDIHHLSLKDQPYKSNYFSIEKILNETCSICWDKLNLEAVVLTCKHYFHEKCIQRWITENKSCPFCRQLFSENIVRTEFILQHIFSYLLEGHYNFNAKCTLNQREKDVLESIKQMIDIFRNCGQARVKSLCEHVFVVNECILWSILNTVSILNTASKELFSDGITWSRIIAFFTLVGELTILGISKKLPEAFVDMMYKCYSRWVKEILEEWIEDHDGWEDMAYSLHIERREQILRMSKINWPKLLLYSTISIIGTLASIVNLTNNQFNM